MIGDQVGYAFSEDLDPKALVSAARTAAQIARGTPGRKTQVGTPGRMHDHYPVLQSWHDVTMGQRSKLLRSWESKAFERDARIKRVEAYISDASTVVMIVRPDGRIVEDWRPMTIGMVRCTAEENGVITTIYERPGITLRARLGIEYRFH